MTSPCRRRAPATGGTSCWPVPGARCSRATLLRERTDARADRRTVLRLRAPLRRRGRARAPRPAGRGPADRPRPRRGGGPRPGRVGRGLAGRSAGSRRGGAGGAAPRRGDVHPVRPLPHRRRRALLVHHGPSRRDRTPAPAVLRDHPVRPGVARSTVPPRVPAGRRRRARGRSAARRAAGGAPEDPRDPGRRRPARVRHPAAGRRRDGLPVLPGCPVTDLLRPGDDRAGAVFSDAAVLSAMVAVEAAWLRAVVAVGLAPPEAVRELGSLVSADDLGELAGGAAADGNPVIPLVRLLRERLADEPAGRWLHRGLTSQDVLDTALVLCGGRALEEIRRELRRQVTTLGALADQHRGTLMSGRTLTQPAVPITFAVKAANWLTGVLDAADDVG